MSAAGPAAPEPATSIPTACRAAGRTATAAAPSAAASRSRPTASPVSATMSAIAAPASTASAATPADRRLWDLPGLQRRREPRHLCQRPQHRRRAARPLPDQRHLRQHRRLQRRRRLPAAADDRDVQHPSCTGATATLASFCSGLRELPAPRRPPAAANTCAAPTACNDHLRHGRRLHDRRLLHGHLERRLQAQEWAGDRLQLATNAAAASVSTASAARPTAAGPARRATSTASAPARRRVGDLAPSGQCPRRDLRQHRPLQRLLAAASSRRAA